MLEKFKKIHIILCLPKYTHTHTHTHTQMHTPPKTSLALVVDFSGLIEIQCKSLLLKKHLTQDSNLEG